MDCRNAPCYAPLYKEPVSLTRAVVVSPWRVECNAESEGQNVRWDWIRYKDANTSRPTLQVRRLLRIRGFTLLKRATLIQQQIWIDDGWRHRNPPFPPSRSLTHILSASTVLVDTTWWQTNFTKEILNVCPLQCACATAVKRHDSILGLAMRTDTCVCFPYLFDSEKEGYTKETKTTVHGKRTGWLLWFCTHINLQEHLYQSSFFLLQLHKELTMIIINVNRCFERYICNVRVLINENTEKTKEINTVMSVSCFRDKGGRHSYMWHKEGPSSRFNNSIFFTSLFLQTKE